MEYKSIIVFGKLIRSAFRDYLEFCIGVKKNVWFFFSNHKKNGVKFYI